MASAATLISPVNYIILKIGRFISITVNFRGLSFRGLRSEFFVAPLKFNIENLSSTIANNRKN